MCGKIIFFIIFVGSAFKIRGDESDGVSTCNMIDAGDRKICALSLYDADEPVISDTFPAENIEEIQVNGESAKLSANICDGFRNLHRINAAGIGLTEIEPNAFKNCLKLKAIYLNDNQISSLDNSIFDANHELEVIRLNNNKLKAFDTIIVNRLPKLRHLVLSDNQLEEFSISDTSIQLVNLHKIELHRNGIHVLDANEIRNKFPNLQILTMCRTEMEASVVHGTIRISKRFSTIDEALVVYKRDQLLQTMDC